MSTKGQSVESVEKALGNMKKVKDFDHMQKGRKSRVAENSKK